MQPRAVVQVGDGRVVELFHGDLVGRLRLCRLHFDDARISEAHALVSLRGDTLRLLSLRGRFAVDDVVQTEAVLRPGQRLSFIVEQPAAGSADDGVLRCDATVLEVVLPDAVMALEGPGVPLQVMLGTTSVLVSPVPSLRSGVVAEAAAWLSFADGEWGLQRPGGAAMELLRADDPVVVVGSDGARLQLTPRLVPLTDASGPPTHFVTTTKPLRIVARFHSVHIFQTGSEAPPLVLDGVGARIVSELVALAGPTAWDVVAREIWPDRAPEAVVRGRWDAQLSRLRSRLRQAGIRPDLVRSNRHGFVELVLTGDDVVVDEL